MTSPHSREVKILLMDSLLPKITPTMKYKFNMTPLSNNLRNSLLVHEENVRGKIFYLQFWSFPFPSKKKCYVTYFCFYCRLISCLL